MEYKTLIHKRVALARNRKNPTVIGRVRSGWIVLGDDQRLQGYSLLLSDPVQETLNDLEEKERKQFLWDMSALGDTLLKVLNPYTINYSILGNHERALHAHVHPRYETEDNDKRQTSPFVYHFMKVAENPFQYERDEDLMKKIRAELGRRTEVI